MSETEQSEQSEHVDQSESETTGPPEAVMVDEGGADDATVRAEDLDEDEDLDDDDADDDDDEDDEDPDDDDADDADDDDNNADDGPRGSESSSMHDRLEQEGDVAADYLEELLDIADLDGDLDMDVDGERAIVSIVGAELQQLVGDQGRVLDALQELTRLAVYRETGERSRLMLDISGHRAARRRELEELATATVAEVKESGERAALRPMTPFERKVVHDAVAAAGLVSESEGVEPRRFVVILPA
jgi:spoIIIJ-associated protein